jgi:hypothetical protein
MQPATSTGSVSSDRLPGQAVGGWVEDAAALKARQLAELDRLFEAGAGTVRLIQRCLDGELSLPDTKALIGGGSVVNELVRAMRAVRQVIVLEQELTGERPAPDRDAEPRKREARSRDGADGSEASDGESERGDLDDLNDYDNGPLDQVIARVRKALRIAAPADDPFAPPAERKRREDAAPSGGSPSVAGAARAASGSRGRPPFVSPPKPAMVSPGPAIRAGRRALLGGVAMTALGGAVQVRGPPR